MRTRQRAAYGAALLYVLTAAPAFACPVAADLDGAGIRFVGADGTAVIHRRASGALIDIDFVTSDTPGASRSSLFHGTYLHSFSEVDPAGQVAPNSIARFIRGGKEGDLPPPTPGLIWNGTHTFVDGADRFVEDVAITVGAPTTWTLGACSYRALPVVAITSADGQESYRETMTYLPDLGTAVLVAFQDPATAPDPYTYVDIRVEGQ